MQIRTLHIRGYRHFEDIVIHDLGAINVFAGPNNAGKTSILRAARQSIDFKSSQGTSNQPLLPPCMDFGVAMESCPGKQSYFQEEIYCSIGPILPKDRHTHDAWNSVDELRLWGPTARLKQARSYRYEITEAHVHGDMESWRLPSSAGDYGLRFDLQALQKELRSWLSSSFFLWHRRKSEYAGPLQKQDALDPDAVHLAARLDQLRSERPRAFHERLEAFINAVIPGLGEPTTRRREDGKVEIMFGDCSLEELGGGVEQVLVLAVILLGEPDQGCLFLEEPESHLHPDAQHRLVEQILAHRGRRQIFLTTHSPVFLNDFGEHADVFRVTRANGKARVERSLHRGHQRHVLDVPRRAAE